jgi:type IV pilus assembly protein PilW
MNKLHTQPLALRGQRGLGLVEVLVAMTIGLVMLGGVGYLFVGSKTMNSTQSDVVRMQESARNAMDVIGRALRQAGYKLNVDKELFDDGIAGTDGGVASGVGGAELPDTLVVRHDPAWVSDATNPLKGQENDCEGNAVTSNNMPNATTGVAPMNPNLVQYRFSIVAGQLVCHADPNAASTGGAIVAANVEDMQIMYGIGNGNEVITRYTATPTALEFTRVGAVRVSLLVRGPTARLAVGGSQTLVYNGASITRTDGYLRQAYTSTFTIRNQTRWK